MNQATRMALHQLSMNRSRGYGKLIYEVAMPAQATVDLKKFDEIINWCESNIGTRYDTWHADIWNSWIFARKEDAVLFQLTWS